MQVYDAVNRRTGSATGPVYESYQYDANRNLSLTWDANNRASAISGRTYSYDPADYRIGKGGTGATLNYYLDGEHLDAVYDGGITVQSQHLRGSIIDEVVYSYQRDNTNKLVAAASHHDALQSVLGESNHQGAIQYRQSYTAFGTATNTSQPQRYTGREMDSESGLYYYRARYYDPTTGRFISEDPLGFQAGVNFYAYCLNNPVNCNDPSGLLSLEAIRNSIGAGIMKSLPGIDSPVEKRMVDQFFFGKGAPFFLTPDETKRLNQNVNTSEFNFGIGRLNPAPNGRIDVFDFDPQPLFRNNLFDFSKPLFPNRTPINEFGTRVGDFLGDAFGGQPFEVFPSPSPSPSSFIPILNNISASGGFLLYPNKSNINTVANVYSK